jgi:hypothetical protein
MFVHDCCTAVLQRERSPGKAARRKWLFPLHELQHRMAAFTAQPEGLGPFSRQPVLPVIYVE